MLGYFDASMLRFIIIIRFAAVAMLFLIAAVPIAADSTVKTNYSCKIISFLQVRALTAKIVVTCIYF